ncbi:MAG TPA: DUF378 domain-containing protein [Patescibacteria group bacterium]
MKKLSGLNWVAMILAIVGAVNWGLVGAFNFNLVDVIFGSWPTIVRIVYVIIGLAGIYFLTNIGKIGGGQE